MASDAQADQADQTNQANDEHLAAAGAPGPDDAPAGTSLAAFGPPAPAWLRLARGGAGLALLAGAWGALLGAVVLGLDVLNMAARQRLPIRVALYAAGAAGVVWLGAVGVAALIVGAFCLTLALRNRGW